MALTEEDLKTLPEDGIDSENPGKYHDLLNDLQGNILKGHGRDHSVHLFLQFKPEQVESVKEWIQNFAQKYITSAKKQAYDALRYRQERIPGDIFANFFLSRHGYEYLEIEPFQIPTDQPFRMGMKNEEIRTYLGDPKIETWEIGFQNQIHALLLIADDDIVDLLQFVNQITQKLRQIAEVIHREDGFILRNQAGQIIEHFGFVDGVSQPLFMKRDVVRERVNNCGFDKWDPKAPLDSILVKDPNGKTEDSYGSYLVYRKLEQNVKGFRENQRELAKKLNLEENLAGALIVGRFYDGTPVTLSDIPSYAVTPTNNFNYDDDKAASKCPFHAHTRKTNPRGDTARLLTTDVPFDEAFQRERGHRITRRAVSYGENDPSKEPETCSGLLFLCFQSNIENQFNFIQARWANPNNFVKVNTGPDPLIGQPSIGEPSIGKPSGTQKWPKKWGESDTEEYGFSLWIQMKGGEYFFAPSISFLNTLALGKPY